LVIVLSVLGFTASDYAFGIFKPISFVCPFPLFSLAIALSTLLELTVSDYPFGIFKLFLPMQDNIFLKLLKILEDN
jgi:hypothetical protein